jgi:hypothetical protein
VATRTWRRGCRRVRCARRAPRPGRRGTGRRAGATLGRHRCSRRTPAGWSCRPGRRGSRRPRSAARSCCRSRRRRRSRRRGSGGGCSAPAGTSASGVSGGPKHKMSVTAIGRWAMPSTSRITPPTPVLAPPNGSTADGWLWVSALSASRDVRRGTRRCRRCRRRPTDERGGDRSRCTAQHGEQRRPVLPVVVGEPARNVLWAQCSLQVWANVSSSTSVGARPRPSKWVWIATSSSGSSASARRPHTRARARGMERRLDRADDHRSMTGLATSRATSSAACSSSTPSPNSTGGPSRPR